MHFYQYFTFTGCPDEIYVGKECVLEAVGDIEAPIKIEAIPADGFSIRSLEGHPEGKDRLINFRSTTYSYKGATNIRLRVQASGPVSNASYLGPLNSETVARYSWSRFSKNLQKRINNSSTTYITDDKTTYWARSFRPMSPEDTIVPPNNPGIEAVEVIDPSTVDTSKITNKVPLYPVDTEYAKLEQNLREKNPAATTETSALLTETPAGNDPKADVTITETIKISPQNTINPS